RFSGLSVSTSSPVGSEAMSYAGGTATDAISPGGHFDTIGGGGGRSGTSSSGGINNSSGPGLTARITQTLNSGHYDFSGNQDLDAALIGSKWTITNLTYSFPTSGSFYQTPYYNATYLSHQIAFNAAQQTAVRYALALVASYTGLTFTEVTESNSTHGNLRYSQTSSGITSAEGNFPGSDTWDGDIWFNSGAVNPQPFYQTPNIGNWGQATIMHETGHTLGLKHGHQDYTNVDLTVGGYIDGPGPRYGSRALTAAHDGQAWSLMTYRSDPGAPINFQGDQFNQPQTYMMEDIAALQYLYGANFTAHSGNDTYTFSATTGEMFINGVSQGDPDGNKIFRTIWDGNGIDTYDLSNFTGNQSIDLRPGNWTTFNSAQLANNRPLSGGPVYAPGNIANALQYNGDARSLIENAIGGSGNDIMYGNDANNTLTGGSGNDYLYGIAGNDTNWGGLGNDTLDESLAANGGNDAQYGEGGDDWVY
ncbi:MAG: M10 family metallopeptidase, partial [Asticcacaulis sp.]|nr:M10 family metallopeptidase [Asticcacaulis sp.]